MSKDTRLEKSIENRLVKAAKRMKGIAPKLVSPGIAGMPDRLVILPGGRVYFVETKRPRGGKVAPRQGRIMEWLRRLGCNVRVANTDELIDAFIREVGKDEI